ncbi:MAG: DUF433 domain-containing protein [Planctomycetes bacterium]|nr:DUF433 domain-containing protein [Planctomycetota bacterium]
MTETELLSRIITNRKIFGGAPIIKGTRLPVATVLSLLAQGETFDELIEDFEIVTKEDLLACIAFAASLVKPAKKEAVGGGKR